MKKIRKKAPPAEPLEQMTFGGQWEYACPYCGNLLIKSGEELRCTTCGQEIELIEKGERPHANTYSGKENS